MLVIVTLNTSIDRALEVPHFAVGETLQAKVVSRALSGKGVNVNRCLSDLGFPSTATGFIGRWEEGLYRAGLAGTAVTLDFITVEGPTRTNTTILDPLAKTDGLRTTHLREEGFQVTTDEKLRLSQKLIQLAELHGDFLFAGSLPPGLTPREFSALLLSLKELGPRVMVDTSGEALREAAAARPFLIKPNEQELADLTAGPVHSTEELLAAATSLLDRIQYVLVTRGAGGAVLVSREGIYSGIAALEPARVRSTVGCGDALLAGFLSGFLAGTDLAEALRRGVAAGAGKATASDVGCVPLRVYEELLDLVHIDRLD
jgi:1-phosphofructokinase family hexose kinase